MHNLFTALHSRVSMMLASLLAIAAAAAFCIWGGARYPVSDGGIVPQWGLCAVSPGLGVLAPVLSTAIVIATACVLAFLNKAFNLLRGYTLLQSTLYLCMAIASPSLLATFNTGVALSCVLALCCVLMYGSYGEANNQRQVFLAFFLLSACSALDYAFAVYVPVMWIAVAQMRIFSVRSLMASLMGIATPWIIYFGFGLTSPDSLAVPELVEFDLPPTNDLPGITILCTALFTVVVAVICWLQNVMKIYSYNAQSRAQLGLIGLMMLVTIVAMCVNIPHASAFMPTLWLCASIQAAHMFAVIYHSPRSAVAILLLILIYLSIFAWRIMICFLP